MSDQVHLLRHGIPTEIAVGLAVVTIAVLAAVLFASRWAENGERTLRLTAGVLCVAGLAIAGFVAYNTVILNELPPCVAGSSGCAIVENSDYSHLFGIHISVYGIIGYLLILGATVMRGDPARLAAFVLSLFGFGFSLYLTYLELWEIYAICQWCVGSAVGMTLLFIVNTARIVTWYGLDDPPETKADINGAPAGEG
jgi:uncharacterized membrane protein